MLATRAIRGRKKDASPSLCSHPRHPPPDCDATTVWTRFLTRLYARLYAREGLTGNAFAMISCVCVRRRKGFFSVLTTSEAITPPDGDAMPVLIGNSFLMISYAREKGQKDCLFRPPLRKSRPPSPVLDDATRADFCSLHASSVTCARRSPD